MIDRSFFTIPFESVIKKLSSYTNQSQVEFDIESNEAGKRRLQGEEDKVNIVVIANKTSKNGCERKSNETKSITLCQSLRRVFKLVLAGWRSQPMGYRASERQSIIERLESISLKSHFSADHVDFRENRSREE